MRLKIKLGLSILAFPWSVNCLLENRVTLCGHVGSLVANLRWRVRCGTPSQEHVERVTSSDASDLGSFTA
jgi:hypothetical protein